MANSITPKTSQTPVAETGVFRVQLSSMNSPARLRKARYRRSAKGQAADARGKAASERYKRSEKGKAAAKRYRQSNTGKAAQAKAKARYKIGRNKLLQPSKA
jgi:hypothetical protein